MTSKMGVRDNGSDPKIRSWRIVAGAYFHFLVPAYVISLAITCLLKAMAGASSAAVAQGAISFSGWFAAGYGSLAIVSVIVTKAIEPVLQARRRKRMAADPRFAAKESEQALARTLNDGRRAFGGRAALALEAIRGRRWDPADPHFQALAVDLAEIVRTSGAALASAPVERREAIMELTATSLDRIDDALAALIAERSRLDEGDARAVSRYLEMRYGPSDFAGGDI
jgi:hypothetical protein